MIAIVYLTMWLINILKKSYIFIIFHTIINKYYNYIKKKNDNKHI